jgi:hypothetical protein
MNESIQLDGWLNLFSVVKWIGSSQWRIQKIFSGGATMFPIISIILYLWTKDIWSGTWLFNIYKSTGLFL